MPILIKPNGKEIEVNDHMMKCHKDGLLKGYKLPVEPDLEDDSEDDSEDGPEDDSEPKLKKLTIKKGK